MHVGYPFDCDHQKVGGDRVAIFIHSSGGALG